MKKKRVKGVKYVVTKEGMTLDGGTHYKIVGIYIILLTNVTPIHLIKIF